jgi:hypothetical protein
MAKLKSEEEIININPSSNEEAVKITLQAFVSSESLPWMTQTRLEHYVQTTKTEKEMTHDEWIKILATL